MNEVSPSKAMKAVNIMDWTTFLAALLGALAGVIGAIFAGFKEFILDWFKVMGKNMRARYASRLGGMAEFIEAVDNVGKVSDAISRVIVFRGKNGGGLPSPGKPYTSKGMMAWAKDGVVDPMKRYGHDLVVDDFHARLLAEMVKDGKVSVDFDKVPDTAKLKTYYRGEGVTHSILYFLNLDGDELLYLSVGSFGKVFTDADLVLIGDAVDVVRWTLTMRW